ncbi:beta-galactosidase [Nakamurella aerolata]|uniref:Beta-galactosidase n=1 Tax=Nakamurella aerolata TaxID=1656892 RepID=A0A849A5K9_9ACTN|nr:beta-galactosidase [Nakamurella aerolata]NNG35849.1 beta-galactosidase [Nakamurella aerolata]
MISGDRPRFDPSSIRFGGDYNPEHWPPGKVAEDVELMQRAGVNLVSLGIFGWAVAEPTPGGYDFGYYRGIMDQLHAGGIGVSLATMTASPPPWLARRFPDSLPELADGTRWWPGARQAYCPSNTDFRDAVRSFVGKLAEALGEHPALQLWHVNNEYGCHLRACYCDRCAAEFRTWLQDRYGDIGGLNEAWTTTFWSQRYSEFAEVLPPRSAPTFANPAQQLDFQRFSSDNLLRLLELEIGELRAATPQLPLTTNFVAVNQALDLWKWTERLDVVSFDSYSDPADPDSFVSAAFDYDVVRSLHAGRPWLLMEQAPSAVNWRQRNAPKPAGKMRAGSWQAVARGADAVMFFQWRASPGGAEKFHSGMVGHSGPGGRVFGEVSALGNELAAHPEPTGLASRADTALLLDWDSWWALELDSHPSADLRLRLLMTDWYAALLRAGVAVDAARPGGPHADRRLLLAPNLYLLRDDDAAELARWVGNGGVLVVGCFSGVVDGNDRIHPGGAPGPLRELVGATVDEWWPLQPGETVPVTFTDAAASTPGTAGTVGAADSGEAGGETSSTASTFTESLVLTEQPGSGGTTTQVLARFGAGELDGQPAVVRRQVGKGWAYYVAARLDAAGVDAVLAHARAAAGVDGLLPTSALPAGVEVVQRGEGDRALLFAVNHTAEPVDLPLPQPATDLLTGRSHAAIVSLGRYGVAMLRRA